MLSRFKDLLFTDTGKDTGIVLLGTFLNILAGGLFFVFAPRILGPADYGLFSTIIATAMIATAIANFGLDTGILRFISKDDETKTNKILSLAFKTYIILGLAVAILGFIIAPYLASLLAQPVISGPLRIAFAGSILLLLTNFFVAGLQAKRQFLKASIVNLSANISRLLILLAGLYFFKVGIYFLTILFFFTAAISVVVGKFYLRFKSEKIEKPLAVDYFKYNFWVGAALILASIPFDNYFLLKITGPIQTGLYFAPFKILTFAYQFGGSFTRVLASRFSSFDTNQKVIEFAKKALIFPAVFIIVLLFLIIIAQPIILLFFGSNYFQSIPVIRILAVGFIFFFASTIPSSMILYYFGKSQIAFFITLLRYTLFIALLVLFVPQLKAVGAALAFSISELFAFVIMGSYAFLKIRK